MIDTALAIISLLLPEMGPERHCTSTIFGQKGDKWAGGNALYLGRPVDPARDIGVAHRTIPLGAKVMLLNPMNGLVVSATVIDRGPYGAIVNEEDLINSTDPDIPKSCSLRPGGKCWYVKKRRSWPGRWRGCLDITPMAAKLLGHSGKQVIHYRRVL